MHQRVPGISVEKERSVKGKLPRISFRSRRNRTPSTQALIVIFITLFILFLWFNFGMAQQIESIGREIQAKTEKLESIERYMDARRQEIAVEGSQAKMSARARVLGYQAQAPFFLRVAEPLPESVSEASPPARQSTAAGIGEGVQGRAANRLLLLLSGQLANSEFAVAP